MDSASIATNQLEEPTSPLDSSTKSVDELLQVFILFCVAMVLRMLIMRYMAASALCMMMFFVLLFLLVCLFFLCVDLYRFVVKQN